MNGSQVTKMNKHLRPYMVYSRGGGSEEGAMLVFAHTVKEAKKTAWNSNTFIHDITDGEYIDMAVEFIKDSEYLFKEANQELLKSNTPHIIETPHCCKSCEKWGYELNEDGYCESCLDEIDFNKDMEKELGTKT
jgi:hypothetical protein